LLFTFGIFSLKANAKTHPIMEVTWEDYYQTAETLMQKIEDSDWDFDHIICIARGGMPIGDMLSRVFKMPLGIIQPFEKYDHFPLIQLAGLE